MPLFAIVQRIIQHKNHQRFSVLHQWQQQRQIILAIALTGVFLTLGRLSLDPTIGKRSLSAFTFPQAVPLSEWQLLDSHVLDRPKEDSTNSYDAVLASRKYLYTNKDRQLEIEMRYMASSSGKLEEYLNRHTAIRIQKGQLLQSLRQQKDVGFYSLFAYKGRVHLAACINSNGTGTVTSEQFLANRYTYDLQPQHLLSWSLSQASLLENRCLWANLSLPLNQSSPTTTYQVLERAWLSWYRWWSSRFPQS
jgi:cyanosortase A-associated protein